MLLAALLTAWPLHAEPPATPQMSAARIGGDGERTRFVADLDFPVSYNVYVLPDPYRVIVDLPEVDFQLPPGLGDVGRGLVKAYRYGQVDAGKSRIVIDLTGPALIEKSFAIAPRDGQPARMVVDLIKADERTVARLQAVEQTARAAPPAAAAEPETAPEAAPDAAPVAAVASHRVAPLPRPKPDMEPAAFRIGTDTPAAPAAAPEIPVVVIDPGHGGIDPGTVSPRGVREKDVVLSFARHLKEELERSGRVKVLLTRDDDRFLSLRDRVRVARDSAAGLLIAVHADSLRQTSVRGATVYTLSDKGSDDEAEALAHKENRSDIIGGVDLGDETEEVTGILIDLAQRETKNHSMVFAKKAVGALKPVTDMAGRPLRSAGFRVLKAPDVPSVLLELGYLSNARDEANLTNDDWHRKTARAMSGAIAGYFSTMLASGH